MGDFCHSLSINNEAEKKAQCCAGCGRTVGGEEEVVNRKKTDAESNREKGECRGGGGGY